ncbi:MAG: hypothetical protein PHW11_07800 [Anaerolineaceae bacterium]|mgnify:CR=1 FL=1|jgi:hypothetical protein|nr:hypothetical protein [Anaerolineaceae bacterium]MDD4042528.1 hypothetical protein [Anaerolineaceae bacterium]MDD4577681.1 hypothetical protein [Anaerolineaceae bacterium]
MENQKRYLWCERTEAEYREIKAEIEARRVQMLNLDNPVKFDWPAKKRDMENWLERGSDFIEGYRTGSNEAWDSICDRAQYGWNRLKTEARGLLDDTKV